MSSNTFTLGTKSVNRLGYGAMQLAGPGVFGPPRDRHVAITVLREALALGVTHIDTSDFYGPHVTNQIIREALYPYSDDLTIVTKIGARRGEDASWLPAFSPAELQKAVHDNLRNLGLDVLDVVNLRVMMGDGHGPAEGSIEASLTVLAEMQQQGLVKHIGLSNVTPTQVAEARKIAEIVCVQNEYNIAHRADDAMIDALAHDGIAYVPFFPLGGFTPLQSSTLSDVAASLGATPMQVALAWLLQRSPNILLIPGTSSEESPENKTGIVRCDLIDCANNFKEITTMPARSLCQNFLNNILAPLHLYRQKSLIDATNAVINGASLTLTSIGRHLTGTASVKNKIKRVDRLLGNRHLQNEVSTIFQRITQKITRGMSRVVILIDWSAYHASRFQLLRASLACDGRSLPLMSCVVPSSQTANADVHERFLESLAECFSPGTDVIVITDAGFQGRWFQQLRSRGWTYICRVLGNHYYNVGNGWEKVSDSGTKASTTAIYLGEGLLGRDKNAQHEGHFYLYKSKPKGRRFKRSKERATRPSVTAKARTAGKSPWFIFTNSTEFSPKQVMKLYSRRMQIEQNFRDEKNPRWGFGLRFGASHSSGRVTVLSLIATLASIIMWLSGFSLENKGIHHKYQANTVKHRRVISLLKLAENVIRHSPLILNTLSLDAGLKVLQQRYTNMIMVY
ncbi:putative oxidoreductase ydbC [Escherichia coli LT-68]|nr:putative oxidoreductase ydbC [Escherichia coli LT-68]